MASSATRGGVVSFSISVGGSPISYNARVYSIRIEKSVNRIPSARIELLDGDSNTQTFAISSSSTFVPGSTIVIEAGYDNTNAQIFSGIITGQSLRVDDFIGSSLVVECRDVAVKMIVGRKCLTFSQQTDSDIISSILGNYSDLTPSVTSTTTTWPEQVQYYVTDWDFVLARAEVNGMIVTALDGTLSVIKPDATTTSVLTTGFGINTSFLECKADLDAVSQLSGATASTWDYKTQAVTTGQATTSLSGPGNLSCSTLADVVGLSSYQLQTSAPLETADLTSWSQAQLVKSEYAKIRGEVKVNGVSTVAPAQYITLQGMGDRFNGDHIVSGIVQDISDGNWTTTISFGMSPMWFIQEPDVLSPSASGLLPGARGLFSGTVKQMYQDPDSQYRILVNVPLFDQNGAGIWARLTNFYSTSSAGAFFLPEVNDEVIVAFLNEDPRYPIILGSMYSSSSLQPASTYSSPDQTNQYKAIVSKSGVFIQFDDTNKTFTIQTPNKNQMIFDDTNQNITIKDQTSNQIVMSTSGISMTSPQSITIKADQSVTIQGTTGVTIQAEGGNVSVSGMNISGTADTQYSITGSESVSVNGGAEMQLTAGLININ